MCEGNANTGSQSTSATFAVLLGTDVDSFSLNCVFIEYSLFSGHVGYLERTRAGGGGGTSFFIHFRRTTHFDTVRLLQKKVKSKVNGDFGEGMN